MANVKKLLSTLSKRGPHRVLRGDMAIVGLPGVVYTPTEGKDLPGIALGHGWLTGPRAYYNTLSHLASWGIVAGCPATETRPLADDQALADDLNTTLSIISEVRLGLGNISVHRERLGVAGHGFGAGAAVLAAADSDHAKSLAALFPAPTSKRVLAAAHRTRIPALVLSSPDGLDTFDSNALPLRRSLQGDDVALRIVPKSTNRGLAEGRSVRRVLGDGSGDRSTQKLVRGVLTGFLLSTLSGDKTYSAFADPATALGSLITVDPETHEDDQLDPFSRLLRR